MGCTKHYVFALGFLRPPGLFTRKRRRGDRYVKRDVAAASEGDLDAEMVVARAIIGQRTGTFDPSTHRDRYQEALRALIGAKLKGLPIKRREVITPPPVIDLMAALKRSLAQDMLAISGTTAKKKRARPAADRRQRSLLLPVAGSRKRKVEPATESAAVAIRPRKKASPA